jgi:hypothetical protein
MLEVERLGPQVDRDVIHPDIRQPKLVAETSHLQVVEGIPPPLRKGDLHSPELLPHRLQQAEVHPAIAQHPNACIPSP